MSSRYSRSKCVHADARAIVLLFLFVVACSALNSSFSISSSSSSSSTSSFRFHHRLLLHRIQNSVQRALIYPFLYIVFERVRLVLFAESIISRFSRCLCCYRFRLLHRIRQCTWRAHGKWKHWKIRSDDYFTRSTPCVCAFDAITLVNYAYYFWVSVAYQTSRKL